MFKKLLFIIIYLFYYYLLLLIMVYKIISKTFLKTFLQVKTISKNSLCNWNILYYSSLYQI